MRQETSSFSIGPVIVVACLASLVLTSWSCKEPVGAPHGNMPPHTRLANVPPDDPDSLYISNGIVPEAALSWVGDDEDGLVIAYKYRWTSEFGTGSITTPWTTIMNIVRIGGLEVPSGMVIARGNTTDLFRIFDFLATIDKDIDTLLSSQIRDSLRTRRPFAIPYRTGIIPGDSLIGGDTLQNHAPTSGSFIFYSPSRANKHTFEVKAVDNDNAEDPFPATVRFWTLESPRPIVIITAVPPAGGIAIRHITDTFKGLLFTFRVQDASTFVQDFSWKVDSVTTGNDSTRWSPWQPTVSAIGNARVTALHFADVSVDTHRFYVRVRNKWGALSNVQSVLFTATVPDFDDPALPRRTLIINHNYTGATAGTGTIQDPDSTGFKNFYSDVMNLADRIGKFDLYTSQSRAQNLPTFKELGKYSSLVFSREQRLTGFQVAQFQLSTAKQQLLRQYLDAGGKLIFISPQNVESVFPSITSFVDWADTVLHMRRDSLTSSPVGQFIPVKNSALDFVGAKGTLNYPSVSLDPTKFHVDSSMIVGGERVPAMRGIVLGYPRGFGETISTFDSGRDSTRFENKPLAVRYLAGPPIPPARPTYSVIRFGFPLYYGNKSQVVQTLVQAFIDFNE